MPDIPGYGFSDIAAIDLTDVPFGHNVMIYWVTESIGPSFLTYYDYAKAGALTWMKEGFKSWIGSSKVPEAFALFPADIGRPPREWAERFFRVERRTEMPR